jgi:hypothetical protein
MRATIHVAVATTFHMNRNHRVTIWLVICLSVLTHAGFGHAQVAEPARLDLNRRFAKVDTEKPTWEWALELVLNRASVPSLLETDRVAIHSRARMHGKTEAEAEKIFAQFKVHLKDVTLEDTIKFILKDQPNYRYEVVDGSVLHVYPVGIQNQTNWPLNSVINHFAIEQKDISKGWYRKQFEGLVDPVRIDLGTMRNERLAACLSPRVFEGVTIRQVLIELSKTCRCQWVFEPLPPEELKVRIEEWGDGFYPQGKKIEARGGDWYQLYGAPVGPDSVVDGVLK